MDVHLAAKGLNVKGFFLTLRHMIQYNAFVNGCSKLPVLDRRSIRERLLTIRLDPESIFCEFARLELILLG